MAAQAANAAAQSNYASRLRQGRVQAQRQTSQNRETFSEFQGGRPITKTSQPVQSGLRAQGSQIDESAVYNRARNARAEAQQFQNQQQAERANREKWMRDRMNQRERLQQYIQPPQAYRDLDPQFQKTPEIQEAYAQFQGSTAAIMQQDRAQQSRYRQAQITMQNLKGQVQRLEQTVQKFKEAMEKAKRALDWGWTTGSVVTVAEAEGAMAESVNTSGASISFYRIIRFLLRPHIPFGSHPDDGKFFKGLLAWAEPSTIDLARMTGWVTILHGIYSIIVIGIIIVLVLAVLTIGGAFLFLISDFAGAGAI